MRDRTKGRERGEITRLCERSELRSRVELQGSLGLGKKEVHLLHRNHLEARARVLAFDAWEEKSQKVW